MIMIDDRSDLPDTERIKVAMYLVVSCKLCANILETPTELVDLPWESNSLNSKMIQMEVTWTDKDCWTHPDLFLSK
jgi:hypothetical protein